MSWFGVAYGRLRAVARHRQGRCLEHDSIGAFLRQDLPLYAIAAIVIGLLFAGGGAAAWIGLAFSVGVIAVSTFIYSPRVIPQRQPGPVEWFEVLTFTGLHYVAATMLLYEVTARTPAS